MIEPPSPSAASDRPARPARTVFLGSGAFAVPVLRALLAHPSIEVVGVVTPPDRPAGRRGEATPVPVAVEARRFGLPLLQPERVRTPETAAAIKALAPDLGVLADFGRIVPPSILELPRHGILNVHPSLLPRHRGATPVPATILAGDPEAGVAVMRMDEGLDTGPLLGDRSWPLEGSETAPELEARAAREGAGLLGELLGPYLLGRLETVPQDEALASLTRPLRRGDGRLDPARPAVELERQVRAFQPWPGSFVETPLGRLVVLKGLVAERGASDPIGAVVADGLGLALVAADGRLRLLEVQPAGRRPMTGAAFRRGHPAVVGQIVSGAS
ncbi:MAG: methionyl-tRNA formyltransferase [Chloroflexota bacterium]|nr:MAG: methionyl-tRNA formyltransferase [Chloroflexota bacterium]